MTDSGRVVMNHGTKGVPKPSDLVTDALTLVHPTTAKKSALHRETIETGHQHRFDCATQTNRFPSKIVIQRRHKLASEHL